MILGTTYSHKEISFLKLDNEKGFSDLLELGFDIIRLGCYWDEIQPQKDTWDLTQIKKYLSLCEEREQKVLLTIGMKSPRWPEYYIPEWLKERAVSTLFPEVSFFLQKCIEELQQFSCITHWQVENEPTGISGPDQLTIPLSLLEKEVTLVRSLDTRPIVINAWGDDIEKQDVVASFSPLSDIIGFDLYYKTPKGKFFYQGPQSSQTYFKQIIKSSPKPVWIIELQAEPWETTQEKKFGKNPRSMSPKILLEHYQKTLELSAQAILFWGYEYWYLRKEQKDNRYFDLIRQLIKENP